MNNLTLLMKSYRDAVEARQRYVYSVGIENVDTKVDRVLVNNMLGAEKRLRQEHGTNAEWFRRNFFEITELVKQSFAARAEEEKVLQ